MKARDIALLIEHYAPLSYQEEWDKEHEQCKLTVIYMEGTVGSLEELEELLK